MMLKSKAGNKVTQAVHDQAVLIVAQLWHVGRVSHPDLLNGETPVSASACTTNGSMSAYCVRNVNM